MKVRLWYIWRDPSVVGRHPYSMTFHELPDTKPAPDLYNIVMGEPDAIMELLTIPEEDYYNGKNYRRSPR